MKSIKVLISAYACEPNQGSESGLGWNVVSEVSKYHQVWVLTSNCHRQQIEAYLAVNPLPNLQFVYIDPLNWILDWSHSGKGTRFSVYFHYYLWQLLAYFISKSLHKNTEFNVVHHVTYGTYWSPSFLSILPVPFIWGPVGGGESAPRSFWKDFSLQGKVYEAARNLLRFLGELDPFVHMTAKRSIVIRATTEDTAKRLYSMGVSRVEILLESCLKDKEIASLAQCKIPDTSLVKFISIGRLLNWKGFHLGLRAFAQANLLNAEYWIVGDGFERENLQILVEELKIAPKVKFWGRLTREDTLEKLGQCNVLVHPSLHDSGGSVCLEAMAASRPVICLDLGGPSIQVTEETGFKIMANSPEQVVEEIALAMTYLANDPDLRLSMGKAGQNRVKEAFSSESKGQQLAQLYEKISTNSQYHLQRG